MSRQLVLSVEDDDATFLLIRMAFQEVDPTVELQRATDGDRALALWRELHSNGIQPALVLLDLNLPKRTGFELLEEMKRDSSIASVPVVIFSSSSLDSDKARGLALGATAFFTKPENFDGVVKTLKSVAAMMH